MKKVLLIGDIMLDEWVYGDVNRLSPEAPIPIFDVKNSTNHLGGAGNVLSNLKSMDVEPMIITGIAEDKTGHIIKKMVRSICGDNAFYFNIPKSFKKQRICSGQQQIVRIDTGEGEDISELEIEEYLYRLKGKVDIVLVADYGKGAVTSTVLEEVSHFCKEEQIKLLIDPYKTDRYYASIFDCNLVKLNKKEAEWFSGMKIESEDDIKSTRNILFSMFNPESILITLGSNGMAYFDKGKYSYEPYRIVDNPLHIYDVCGAGDVVFATIGSLMATGGYYLESMLNIALKAGKLAVSKKGTSVITKKELF